MFSNPTQILIFLADISLRVAVVAAVAWLGITALRVRGPAVRHRVWCGVLLAMFAMPALILIAPSWGVSVGQIAWLQGGIEDQPNDEELGPGPNPKEGIDPTDSSTHAELQHPNEELAANDSQLTTDSQRAEFSPENNLPAELGDERSASMSPMPARTECEAGEPLSTENASTTSAFWNNAAWAVLVGYCVVALVLLVRLAVAMSVVHRMLGRAELLKRIDGVELLSSEDIAVPVTAGIWRPRIIVPTMWNSWTAAKQDAVLRHELSHIARRDVLVSLLSACCCAVYWFHPLSWALSRRLASLAEECCDDAVLRKTAGRTLYARYLLEFASLCRTRRPLLVAMARSGRLTGRIDRILDTTREIPPQPHRTHVAIAVLMTVCVAIAVAGVQGQREAVAESTAGESSTANNSAHSNDAGDTPSQDGATGTATTGDQDSATDAEQSVTGQIVDEEGNPIPAAEVFISVFDQGVLNDVSETRIHAHAKSDSNGMLTIAWPEIPEHRNDLDRRYSDHGFMQQHLVMTVLAPGFVPLRPMFPTGFPEEKKLTLAKAEASIRGRIVDLEGKPIADARMRVVQFIPPRGDIGPWLEESQKNPPSSFLAEAPENSTRADSFRGRPIRSLPVIVNGLPVDSLSATTDADGRFEFSGLPKDALVVLELEGDNVARTQMNVLTRAVESFPLYDDSWNKRTKICYGAEFEYFAEPSQAIRGVVRDADTGEPIANAVVGIQGIRIGNTNYTMGRFLEARTNAAGEYTLHGVARLSARSEMTHTVQVTPARGSAYFRWPNIEVPKPGGFDPISLDIGLKRAIPVSGKLRNAETGEPVNGLVGYFPLMENEHLDDYKNYRRSQSSAVPDLYATDADGSFQLPAMPGPGLLVGIGLDASKYLPGAGAEKAGWPNVERPRYAVHLQSIDSVHSLDRIEIETDAKVFSHDVKLIPMQKQTFEIVDPQGEPLEGFTAVGSHPLFRIAGLEYVPGSQLNSPTIWAGSTVDVFGLEAVERRRLLVRDHRRQWAAAVWVKHRETRQVKLAPMPTVSGRLVDENNQPLTGQRIEIVIEPDEVVTPFPQYYFSKALLRQRVASATTDEEGRFTLQNVFPGVKMELQLGRLKIFEVEPLESGADVDLGDVMR